MSRHLSALFLTIAIVLGTATSASADIAMPGPTDAFGGAQVQRIAATSCTQDSCFTVV